MDCGRIALLSSGGGGRGGEALAKKVGDALEKGLVSHLAVAMPVAVPVVVAAVGGEAVLVLFR